MEIEQDSSNKNMNGCQKARTDKQDGNNVKNKGGSIKMTFNVIVGNPPYDRTDIQMKFASMGYELASDYSLFIIPAKWQCKNDRTKESYYTSFRDNIVPHIKHMKYFIDSADIFDIAELSGITYYITDKHTVYDIKTIENDIEYNTHYNNTVERQYIAGASSLNNMGQQIINKVIGYEKRTGGKSYKPAYSPIKEYNYYSNALITGVGDFKSKEGGLARIVSTLTGKLQLLAVGEVNTKEQIVLGIVHDNYNILYSSDSMSEINRLWAMHIQSS